MALDLSYDELLRYSNDEREKWRRVAPVASDGDGSDDAAGRTIPDRRQVDRPHLSGRAAASAAADGRYAVRLDRADWATTRRRSSTTARRCAASSSSSRESSTRTKRVSRGRSRSRSEIVIDLAAEAALRHPHSRDPALGPGGAGSPHRRHRAAGRRTIFATAGRCGRTFVSATDSRRPRAQRLPPRTTRISRIRSLSPRGIVAAAGAARLPAAHNACNCPAVSVLSASSVVICLLFFCPLAQSIRSTDRLPNHQDERIARAEVVGVARTVGPGDEVHSGAGFHVLPDRLLDVGRERHGHTLRRIGVVDGRQSSRLRTIPGIASRHFPRRPLSAPPARSWRSPRRLSTALLRGRRRH